MADSDDNWFNRRIDPLPKDQQRDVDAILEQLEELHNQRLGGAPAKEPERLIDTFWREHGHKQDQEGAWHLFYSGLDVNQKQQIWNEYHQIVSTSGEAAQPIQEEAPVAPEEDPANRDNYFDFSIPKPVKPIEEPKAKATESTQASKKQELLKRIKHKDRGERIRYHLKPFVSAALAMAFVLLLNYNQLVIAQVRQYVSPGSSLQSPTIIDPSVDIEIGEESRIIIPKINVDVPVVYDVTSYDEGDIQAGLERGVVHYGDTALPGQAGNNVIVGHSSNNFLNSGKYKFAFVLLSKLEVGDTFILHHEGIRYIYKITNKQVIQPDDFSLVQSTPTPTTTLITCDPPGTNWRRLVIQGEQISPDPTNQKPADTVIEPTNEQSIVPGNAPSLFERITNFLFGD